MTADFETFLVKPSGGPRQDIARLHGARFVKSVEVSEGRRLAEGLLKLVSGGDVVTARYLYGREFEYKPQFTLWLAANDAPEVRYEDDALWRRLLRVPFAHEFEVPDPNIKAQLTNPKFAGVGILSWAVKSCQAWQQFGLEIPNAVRESTDSYREEADPVKAFLEDRCVIGPKFRAAAADLYREYASYAGEIRLRPSEVLSNKKFGTMMSERFDKRRASGGMIYHGVGDSGSRNTGGVGVMCVGVGHI